MRALCLLLTLTACAPTDGTPDDDDATDPVDVRVPEPDPDPDRFDLVAPEHTIAPYSDKMTCYYLPVLEEDLVADELETFQGDYGHHIVVLTALEPKPAGTLEDCTDPSVMPNFRPMILPDTPLPEGYAVRIPAGTQPVMQFHYVNPTDTPLLVRDVARVHKVDPGTVSTWAAMIATGDLDFVVPGAQESNLTFDCEIDHDVDVLLLGGHMHEWGTRFEALLGPDADSLASAYLVNPWVPEFRDSPPVNLYFENPLPLPSGSILRTSCSWKVDEAEEIPFPNEMCSIFGYVGGTDQPILCGVEP